MNKPLRLASSLTLALTLTATAQNPIVGMWYTPDPAPYVHNDTLYLFTGHDEDDAEYFKMKDWQLYSTTDLVNWTFRGFPMSTATFQWALQGDNAWASQAVERDGRWYWYVAAEDTVNHLHGIGVAVSDRPEGPYRDAIGKPLVPGSFGFIDPSVFIDDDGRAWLFWGNNGLWYAELGRDMVSLKSEITKVDTEDESAFGPRRMKHDWQLGKEVLKTNFEEAPWVYKRGDTYYLEYAAGGVPEHWAYSTSKSIHGPWQYRGRVLDEPENSFTIHGGAVTMGGRSLMFYHNGRAVNGSGFRRSSAVEEFRYQPDGSIPKLAFTGGIVRPLRPLNPFARVEGETMAEGYGVKTDRTAGSTHYLTRIVNGAWTRLRSVDFGSGAATLSLRARGVDGGRVVFLVEGQEVAVADIPASSAWADYTVPVAPVSGVHDLRLLFRGDDGLLLDLDYWQLKR